MVVEVDRDDAGFFVCATRAVDDQARLLNGKAGGGSIGVAQGFGDVKFGGLGCRGGLGSLRGLGSVGLRGGPVGEKGTGEQRKDNLPTRCALNEFGVHG